MFLCPRATTVLRCDDPAGPAQYGLNVNGIASTPFNAAIGGTDFNQYNTWSEYWNSANNSTTQESAKGYIPETTWNDSCTNSLAITLGYGSTAEQACNNQQMIEKGGVNSTGGSGGPSNCAVNTQGVLGSCTQSYPKPSWQHGTGVPADNKRDLPDVSLFASNGFLGSAYVICEQDKTGGCSLNDLLGYGGTSVASPAFAGIMSLVNEKMGGPQGVPGFALYQLASKQANAFHDVPTGSTIAMPCVTGTPNCVTNTPGDAYGVLSGYSTNTAYDLATGLGSVDAANLVNNWSKASFTATTTTLSLNSGNAVNITHGTAVPVSIAVSSTAASGAVSLLVSNASGTTIGQAIDGFPLTNGATTSTAATSLLPAGSNYYVIAHYGGDGTYGGSYSSPVSVTVSKENSTVILKGVTPSGSTTPVTTVPFDSQYYARVEVGNSQGALCSPAPFGEIACPSGGVIFTDNGTQYNFNTFALNSEGYTETWVGALGGLTGGQHTLGAQYSGDNNYNAGSGSVVVTVTRAATVTTPVTAQGSITQPVALTTDIEDPSASPILPTPTGTVTFYSNGTPIPGTPVYSGGSNGLFLYSTATLTTTFPASGTYTLTASYSGDQNYQPSASTASQVALQYPIPTVLANPASQTVLPGTPVTVTAVVDTTNKIQPPTGTVTLGGGNVGTLGGPTTCTQTTDSRGNYACQATFTFTPPPPSVSAVDFFSAQYSGDANYPASQSVSSWIYITDFSLSPNSPQVTVTQGSSQTVAINVSPLNGFNAAVTNFSCSGLPAETSCSFSPTTVTGGSGSTTLTITTTPLGQMRQMRRVAKENPGVRWMVTAMLPLLGLCLIGIPLRRRPRATLITLMILTMVLLPSCGGGGGGGGQQNNPVPSIASLSPTQQAAGSQSQTLTINGSGFMSTSTATYHGLAHTVSFGSASQISIALSTPDLAATGAFPLVVTNPAPGGGSSNTANFTVVTGTPTGTFNNVTVTATSGSLTQTTTFTLVVQ